MHARLDKNNNIPLDYWMCCCCCCSISVHRCSTFSNGQQQQQQQEIWVWAFHTTVSSPKIDFDLIPFLIATRKHVRCWGRYTAGRALRNWMGLPIIKVYIPPPCCSRKQKSISSDKFFLFSSTHSLSFYIDMMFDGFLSDVGYIRVTGDILAKDVSRSKSALAFSDSNITG